MHVYCRIFYQLTGISSHPLITWLSSFQEFAKDFKLLQHVKNFPIIMLMEK